MERVGINCWCEIPYSFAYTHDDEREKKSWPPKKKWNEKKEEKGRANDTVTHVSDEI